MTNDDDKRIRGLFRRAFDDLRTNAATQPQPAPARASQRAFWTGRFASLTAGVAAAALIAVIVASLPNGRRTAGVGPARQPSIEPTTVADTPQPSDAPSPSPSASAVSPIRPSTQPAPSTPPSPRPTPSAGKAPRGACHGDWAARPKPDGLSVTLSADKTSGKPGDVVRFTITITNDGALPIEYWHGNPRSTVKVGSGRGDEWVSGDGLVYTQELRQETLDSGESLTDTYVWTVNSTACGEGTSEPTPPGTYTVDGAFTTSEGNWIAAPLTFTVQ